MLVYTRMNSQKKNQHSDGDENKSQPMHPYDEDVEYDDGQVEVIRPQGRRAGGPGADARIRPSQDEEEELPPSKTKIKKQMHDLRDLGKELTELSRDQLAQLDLPENLRDAIEDLHKIHKFGAQRRQVQYIGKLMRDVETAPIIAKLDGWKGKSQQHTALLHLLERWRDRLMESDDALTELLAAHPHADAQHLRALIRNAHKEHAAGKPPKSYREIFQALKEIIPEQE